MLKGVWRVGLAVVLVVGVLGPAPDAFAEIDGDDGPQSGGGVQSDGSGGGQVVAFSFEVVTTSASGGSDGGTTTSSSSSGGAYVQPTCWYESRGTGAELATQMQKEHRNSRSSRPPADWKGPWVTTRMDYAAHADDGNGVMLGNCGPEVTGVANNSNIITPGEESYKIAPITTRTADEEVIRNATAELMYNVSDSSEANYAIARGTTAYATARASEHAAASEDPVHAIKNVYDAEANVIHLLTMLDQDQANYAYNGTLAALSILSLVPGANGIMATVANAGLTAVGPPTVDATGHSSNDILLGAAYTNAFNSGNIKITPPTDLKENPWYSTDENGAVRITLETDEQVRSFYSWVQADGAGNS